jgi:hypothetical protein
VAAGVLVGIASRAVDTAAWAPAWIGLVITPWLALAWLTGARTAQPSGDGPLTGLAAMAATAASYLLVAGADAGNTWLVLLPVVFIAGPAYGWAGAAWRSGHAMGRAGLALLGAALLVEGITLQFGDRELLPRLAFVVESLLGLLIVVVAWRRGR